MVSWQKANSNFNINGIFLISNKSIAFDFIKVGNIENKIVHLVQEGSNWHTRLSGCNRHSSNNDNSSNNNNNNNKVQDKREKEYFYSYMELNRLPCHPLHPYLTLPPSSFSTLPQHINILDENYCYVPKRERYSMKNLQSHKVSYKLIIRTELTGTLARNTSRRIGKALPSYQKCQE